RNLRARSRSMASSSPNPKFVAEKIPPHTLRRLVAGPPEPVYEAGEPAPWDRTLWDEIVELGWTALAVPEEDNGAGVSMVGVVALLEEVGRHALPSPLIPTLASSLVLRTAGTERARNLNREIAAGKTVSLVLADERGGWEPAHAPIEARREGSALVLSGTGFFVQDASKVDSLLVVSRLGDERLLCSVATDSTGLRLQNDQIHDLTRSQATVHFDDVVIETSAVVSDDADHVLKAAWPGILVLVAADLVGCSEWQLQTTVEYAKQRVQFDRPLGFFQAVKHPLVDAMVGIDRARSLLYHAACEIDIGSAGAEVAARMAKSAASDAGAFISDRSVQLHGGIGFTWECDVHIFFKRSMHNQALFGDGTYQRQKLADVLIGPIAAR
ncbi:MAG: acyl-CoA dehydrogenase family protein, partial [Myxococcota bacterium]